jgi:hypothetical protein
MKQFVQGFRRPNASPSNRSTILIARRTRNGARFLDFSKCVATETFSGFPGRGVSVNSSLFSHEVLAVLGVIALVAGTVTAAKYIVYVLRRLYEHALTKKGQAKIQVATLIVGLAIFIVLLLR